MLENQRLTEIAGFYQDAFAWLSNGGPQPEIVVEFYPYVALNHTIKVREGRVLVRLSDLSREAPDDAHQPLALILVAKLLNKPISPLATQKYAAYTAQPEVVAAIRARRQSAGRKFVSGPQGRFYNLELMFHKLNRRYFNSTLPQPTLTWSQQEAHCVVGHHDATHDTIVISRALDAPDVPDMVVEFVLYHEMLHIKHPTQRINGRRAMHTAAFRADEKRFAYYDAAQFWLQQTAAAARRAKTRRRVVRRS